ncbi:hypothetical protein [Mycetocola miduiensis]|uniref:RecT family protein n=1 Tax=Mycetocola miduiensis TaxID=995034 RepID=A0A1I5AWS3_9MICO|nr:hypothetical protein [Mycetocola miduiensis]SFN66831.1 hypothetical protein SAMN05216219_1583 [Mycetocola miduiensis]
MSTDITPYRNASLDEKYRYARALAEAGDLLPKGLWANVRNAETGLMENRPSPGKVMLVAETGAMLGIHPMAALQGIDVIEGNPTIKPSLMTALVREAGHTLRIKKTGTIEGGDIAVTATLIRSDDPDFTYESTWEPKDAIRAGLIDSYKPNAEGVWQVRARSQNDNIKPWEAYTPAMLRWRAVGDVVREGAEDVLLGVHYTAEELTSGPTDAGEMVQVTAAPAEDWAALIAAATTKTELTAIANRARAAEQFTDAIRTLVLARSGMIHRGETPAEEPTAEEQVEVVDGELSKEEYERQSAAEHAAAVQS